MAVAEKLSVHVSLHLQSLGTHHRGPLPSGVEARFAELSAALQEYDAACAAVEQNAHLSDEGKWAKQREAHDKALAVAQQWSKDRLQGMDAQLQQQRAALASSDPTPKPTDCQVQHMVQRLQAFDAQEIAVLYSDATDTERRLMEEASAVMGRQPRKHGDRLLWEDVLPEDRVAASVARRAAAANPAAAIAVNNSEQIIGAYRQVGIAAEGLLRESLPAYANH